MKSRLPESIRIVCDREGLKVYDHTSSEEILDIKNPCKEINVKDVVTLIQEQFGKSPKTRSILSEDYEYDKFRCIHDSDSQGFDVYTCVHKMDKHMYLIKTIPVDEKTMQERQREVEALIRAQHPNVLRYYNVWTEGTDSEKELCICTEYCESNLQGLLAKSILKTDEDVYAFFRPLVNAVCHFHGKGVIHRDLSLSNIFIDADGIPKIGEFGRAAIVDDIEEEIPWEDLGFEDAMKADCRAPELVWRRPMSLISQKVDIFSLGMILLELLYSRQICDEERRTILAEIREDRLPGFVVKKGLGSLLPCLLEVDPKSRPDAEDALEKLDLLAKACGLKSKWKERKWDKKLVWTV